MLNDISVAYPGCDVQSLQRDAVQFVGSLSRKSWWTEWRCVVSGEGGHKSLVYNAMLSAADAGEPWHKGFYEYSRRLVKLYGKGNVENANLSLDFLLASFGEDILPRLGTVDSPLVESLDSPGEALAGAYTSYSVAIDKVIKDPEEEYFMLCFSNTGSMSEACEIAGISRQDGHRIYDRVKRRMSRLVLSTPDLY